MVLITAGSSMLAMFLTVYPEQRQCKRPTTEQILRLFSFSEWHTLLSNGVSKQVLEYTTLALLVVRGFHFSVS